MIANKDVYQRCSYAKFEDDKEGFYFYRFMVTCTMANETIIVQIENHVIKASEARLQRVKDLFASVSERINKRLREANIKAEIETKSYREPNLYK